jgi:putative ABC transport system ATP-binding protein
MNLFQSYSSLIKSSGAGDKVFGLLDRSPPAPATGSRLVQSLGGPTAHGETALSLRLENVSFEYPSRPEHYVLKGLNLTIRPGQTVALVGPSGCGKSTVVGLLQRLYDPTQGRVLINGSDLKGLDIKSHR